LNYDPATSSCRTSQLCLVEGWSVFSETWPRSGMMRNGTAYRLPPLVRLTDETEHGLWQTPVADDAVNRTAGKYNSRGEPKLSAQVKIWPTPSVKGNHNRKGASPTSGDGLSTAVKKSLWPTPTRVTNSGGAALCKWGGAGSREKLRQMVSSEELNGALNPTWVEWLMGFPLEWTALEDWGTPSSRKSRKSSGGQS